MQQKGVTVVRFWDLTEPFSKEGKSVKHPLKNSVGNRPLPICQGRIYRENHMTTSGGQGPLTVANPLPTSESFQGSNNFLRGIVKFLRNAVVQNEG